MNAYEDIVYDYLEHLRRKNQEYLRALNEWQRDSEGWVRIRRYLDGLQDAMWDLEVELERADLPLVRPADEVGPYWTGRTP